LLFFYVVLQSWHLIFQSLHSLWLGPTFFAEPFGPKYVTQWTWVVAHGVSACVVLLLGPFLLLRTDIPQLKRWHRRLGKAYLAMTVVAAMTGFPLCLRAEGGWPGQSGFLLMCSLWLAGVLPIYATARTRRWRAHQRWVTAHYLLTCAAILIRLILSSADHYHVDLSAVAPWLAMLPAFAYTSGTAVYLSMRRYSG
jgi:uncharacterized membrane protein